MDGLYGAHNDENYVLLTNTNLILLIFIIGKQWNGRFYFEKDAEAMSEEYKKVLERSGFNVTVNDPEPVDAKASFSIIRKVGEQSSHVIGHKLHKSTLNIKVFHQFIELLRGLFLVLVIRVIIWLTFFC